MPMIQPGALRYYVSEALAGEKLPHAVFTRQGGVSPAPWASLNLGGTVGDTSENVAENRRRAFRAVGRSVESLFDVWQVHSADVVRADAPRPLHTLHRLADAMITDRPEVTLLMRFADCVPILLYDPIRKAVGMVHAGWQGTIKRVVVHAMAAMQAEFRTAPQDVLAVIGPSIGPDHYQIGPEVIAQVQSTFGSQAKDILLGEDGNVRFDLWQANRLLLEQAGVRHVEVAGICTACHPADWFSHRGEQGKTGRFGAIISLKE